jgi:aminoglycoside phosphotransferase (APT) family kinase protein
MTSQALGSHVESAILSSTGASRIVELEVLQELWSGYGRILRVRLEGSLQPSAVVKHVRMPFEGRAHPRGWNTKRSHGRKVKSYQVEATWYRNLSHRCGASCRVPRFLASEQMGAETLLVLEDLDAAGYPARKSQVEWSHMETCLRWLAGFHSTFMGASTDGLWEHGTYWHLATRPDELEALKDLPLKRAAETIDERLNRATFQTLVHGDAKLANFCFSETADEVAAVDFQYTGGGIGMKDVALFIGSCLDGPACEAQEAALLDCYFAALRKALAIQQPALDAQAIEAEWRELFPLAWTDFHRFLKGWSPNHWKINSYSERLAREVLATL